MGSEEGTDVGMADGMELGSEDRVLLGLEDGMKLGCVNVMEVGMLGSEVRMELVFEDCRGLGSEDDIGLRS
eukprot:10491776-Ditylum_brightwellii.AAC.1